MKIDACIIIKNEENTIENVCNNLLKFCRNVYIVDTGSTDKSIEIIQRIQETHDNLILEHFRWINDFSAARNYSFSLSKDSDYIYYCDGDETDTPELIEKLKWFASLEYNDNLADAYRIPLQCREHEWDDPIISYRIALIKTKPRYIWKNPVHEYLDFDMRITRIDAETFKDCWRTSVYFQKERDEFRNLNIIRDSTNLTVRMLYYYGKELLDVGYVYPAILCMIESVFSDNDNVSNTNKVDAAYTYIYYLLQNPWMEFSHSTEEIGQYMLTNKIYNKCIFFMFSDLYLKQEKYHLAADWAIRAYNLSYNECTGHMLTRDLYDNVKCLFNIVVALDRLGQYKMAQMYNDTILMYDPSNEAALENKKYFEERLNEYM